jgi:Cytochrome c7 and related cytochrome c
MVLRRKRTRSAGVLMAGTLGVVLLIAFSSRGQRINRPNSLPNGGVFTTSHPSLLAAVREFFDLRSTPVQPIQFTHKLHLQNGMQCVDCHRGVDKGPVAGIPSVTFCMTCHQVIATDRPEIKKVAAYMQRGEDIPWQRVYYYQPSAHVSFDHAPHIRAGVACAACHGDMKQQTVAVRAVNLTMGYCLDCHRARKASVDCVTCHF